LDLGVRNFKPSGLDFFIKDGSIENQNIGP